MAVKRTGAVEAPSESQTDRLGEVSGLRKTRANWNFLAHFGGGAGRGARDWTENYRKMGGPEAPLPYPTSDLRGVGSEPELKYVTSMLRSVLRAASSTRRQFLQRAKCQVTSRVTPGPSLPSRYSQIRRVVSLQVKIAPLE